YPAVVSERDDRPNHHPYIPFSRRYVRSRMSRRELADGTKKAIQEYIAEKEALLSSCATKSAAALRRYNSKPEDIRAPFSRDTDRIIHTRAYARYIDKTQVFSFVDNDHITHRVLHVQLVSKIARTIGRSLRLNEDLIE